MWVYILMNVLTWRNDWQVTDEVKTFVEKDEAVNAWHEERKEWSSRGWKRTHEWDATNDNNVASTGILMQTRYQKEFEDSSIKTGFLILRQEYVII